MTGDCKFYVYTCKCLVQKKNKTVLKKVSEQVFRCLYSSQMYVSQNSTQNLESNVFKTTFLLSLKLLCFL